MDKWTKKVDEMHITKNGQTLCGRPCLGNNYAEVFPDRTMCEKCLAKNRELKRIVAWGIEITYADGTKEIIADMPNRVSQEIDDYLTEIEGADEL